MKQLILISTLLICSFTMKGQITLEHKFSDYVSWFKTSTKGTMFYTNNIDTISNQLKVYNEDYSLYKTIIIPRPIGYFVEINFLSDQLFNLDNSIEFLCCFRKYTENMQSITKITIFNENATVVKDFGTYLNYDGIFLINESGIKPKLYINGAFEVYSLPGSLPNNVPEFKSSNVKSAFPNPSKNVINLPYSLENGQVSTMKIYNMSGQLIDQKQIDSAFDKILLNVNSYQSGSYIYEYNGISKKFIVN